MKNNRLFIAYLTSTTMMPKDFIKRNYELFKYSEHLYIEEFNKIMVFRRFNKNKRKFINAIKRLFNKCK